MKKTFLVIYEKGKKSYSGFAPDVEGCGSSGNTLEDMRNNLRDALELYMQVAVSRGYSMPEPQTESVTLPIEGELDPKIVYIVEHLTITMPRVKAPALKAKTELSTTRHRAMQAA